MQKAKLIVGWREWIALPDLHVAAIKAKIDTGAKTSSLHAYNIETFKKHHKDFVRFEVHPIQKNNTLSKVCEALLLDIRKVKSSSGIEEDRYVIQTPMLLGEDTWDIEVTLTNRDYMGFRMLLSRGALKHRALIDPSASFLHGRITHKQSITYNKKG